MPAVNQLATRHHAAGFAGLIGLAAVGVVLLTPPTPESVAGRRGGIGGGR